MFIKRLGVALFLAILALCVLVLPVTLRAAAWTGIIDTTRAVDWSGAGVEGGIPSAGWTQSGSTISAGASLTTVNNALAACGTNQYVLLGSGAFSFAGSVVGTSNCELRGSGADATKIAFTGTSSGCGNFIENAIALCGGGNLVCGVGGCPGPSHTATLTAPAQGATTIVINSTTGLAVGSTIWIDQLNESDGFPSTGDVYICNGGPPCSGEGAGSSYARLDRSLVEPHRVTSIEAACGSSCDIGIDPPVASPTFRSGQTPQAWWNDSGDEFSNGGVSALSIDVSAAGTSVAAIGILKAKNTWVNGVRIINTLSTGSFLFHVFILQARNISVVDSYLYGTTCTANCQTEYQITPHLTGRVLVQNNIMHSGTDPVAPNDPDVGSVYAYNYNDDTHYSAAAQMHNSGDIYALFEGNDFANLFVDAIHGTHFFGTHFRNHLSRTDHNRGAAAGDNAIALDHVARFFNVIGNVMGNSSWTTYQVGETVDSDVAIFHLGYKGNCSACGPLSNDTNVARTLFRWGNWDSVTSTNDTGTNDGTGTRFVSGEVPSGITSYANALPSTEDLPNSFYLTACPSTWWVTAWGTPAWPAIGPDVNNGDINDAGEPTGGHANKIPARLAFENLTNDSAYPSSSPRIRNFNAAASYTGGSCGSASLPSVPGFRIRIVG